MCTRLPHLLQLYAQLPLSGTQNPSTKVATKKAMREIVKNKEAECKILCTVSER